MLRRTSRTILLVTTLILSSFQLYAQEGRTLYALPVAFYSTDTGFGGGAAAIKKYRAELPRTSTLQFQSIITTKKQATTGFKLEHYLRGGGDRFMVKAQYKKFPTDFFGIGNSSVNDDPESYTPETFEFESYYEYRVFRSLKLRASVMLLHFAMIETEDGRILENSTLPWRRGRTDAGPGIGVVWDNRDNTIATTQGIFAKLQYNGLFMQNRGDAYNATSMEFRYFKQLIDGLVFASMCRFDNRQGDVPFYLFSSLGGEERLRGYENRRFTDNSSLLFQQDIRFPLFWRFGGALFAAAGRVAPEPGDLLSGRYHAAYGIGGRFILDREEHLVIRADYAQSDDSSGFYITFGEAF